MSDNFGDPRERDLYTILTRLDVLTSAITQLAVKVDTLKRVTLERNAFDDLCTEERQRGEELLRTRWPNL